MYHPSRLVVSVSCQRASGGVELVRHEEDGDLHIDVALDPAYGSLKNAVNDSDQHGDLVVEFMARDGGHLPAPAVGDHVQLVGAWVTDTQHGWREIHPVWTERINGGAAHTSGPQFGGSPPGDRSSDAATDCRTDTGAPCRGYTSESDGTSAPGGASPPSSGGGGATTPSASGGNCEPGYSPCLPKVADLNCSDIPDSEKPIHVTGSDPYRLDANHNGLGCEG